MQYPPFYRDKIYGFIDCNFRIKIGESAMNQFRAIYMIILVFSAITGIIYPLAMTGVAQKTFNIAIDRLVVSR